MTKRNYGTLTKYVDDLLATGRITFTLDEAIEKLSLSRAAFHKTTARLRKQNKLLTPRHGFYVITPPQFGRWGAPPPDWYIDTLMKHEGRPYYVGLLKAAEKHGATHQAVMEYQVITNKQTPSLSLGRSKLVFYFRKNMTAIEEGLEKYKTETGYFKLSCIELTALDLLRYSHAVGGIGHIATVLSEIGSKIQLTRLKQLAPAFERNHVQRLGYLLDYLGYSKAASSLLKYLKCTSDLNWVELEPSQLSIDPDLIHPVTNRDRNWHIIVRHPIEVDE